MMNELKSLSDAQLRTLLNSCREVLLSVVSSLENRTDLHAGITRLMNAGEMVDELNAINGESRDLARLILQAGIAALVNCQSVEAVEAEMQRRAIEGN